MVALSACSSGLGRITGDGVAGLSRAFLGAGTASVVVSLWRVADIVSRHQMEDFYRALQRPGVSRAEALREAQLRTIERLRRGEIRTPSGTPVPEHPLYWAPFVLVGDAAELP
jgi:CHAT domain-containing protein